MTKSLKLTEWNDPEDLMPAPHLIKINGETVRVYDKEAGGKRLYVHLDEAGTRVRQFGSREQFDDWKKRMTHLKTPNFGEPNGSLIRQKDGSYSLSVQGFDDCTEQLVKEAFEGEVKEWGGIIKIEQGARPKKWLRKDSVNGKPVDIWIWATVVQDGDELKTLHWMQIDGFESKSAKYPASRNALIMADLTAMRNGTLKPAAPEKAEEPQQPVKPREGYCAIIDKTVVLKIKNSSKDEMKSAVETLEGVGINVRSKSLRSGDMKLTWANKEPQKSVSVLDEPEVTVQETPLGITVTYWVENNLHYFKLDDGERRGGTRTRESLIRDMVGLALMIKADVIIGVARWALDPEAQKKQRHEAKVNGKTIEYFTWEDLNKTTRHLDYWFKFPDEGKVKRPFASARKIAIDARLNRLREDKSHVAALQSSAEVELPEESPVLKEQMEAADQMVFKAQNLMREITPAIEDPKHLKDRQAVNLVDGFYLQRGKQSPDTIYLMHLNMKHGNGLIAGQWNRVVVTPLELRAWLKTVPVLEGDKEIAEALVQKLNKPAIEFPKEEIREIPDEPEADIDEKRYRFFKKGNGGSDHIMAMDGLKSGNLKRDPGQSLCGKYNISDEGMRETGRYAEKLCGSCKKMAARHDVTIPGYFISEEGIPRVAKPLNDFNLNPFISTTPDGHGNGPVRGTVNGLIVYFGHEKRKWSWVKSNCECAHCGYEITTETNHRVKEALHRGGTDFCYMACRGPEHHVITHGSDLKRSSTAYENRYWQEKELPRSTMDDVTEALELHKAITSGQPSAVGDYIPF